MFNRNTLAAGVAMLAAGLAVSPTANAVTQARLQTEIGSNMCKLSVPTTDSKVRPRATGFRNEGTTNVFVICTFNSPSGDADGNSGATDYGIYVYSIDGANHPAVSCTGVNSMSDGVGFGVPAPQFVVKTLDVNNGSGFGAFGVAYWWDASDFGGAAGDPVASYGGAFSVTCILPPQVGIKVGFSNSVEDIGT